MTRNVSYPVEGWWFSLVTQTTKNGRHEIAQKLPLKVASKHQQSFSINSFGYFKRKQDAYKSIIKQYVE